MAQQNVTSLGSGAGGSVREDLANFISNIDRDETPPVSYTHLRAHETPEHLVCRLLL